MGPIGLYELKEDFLCNCCRIEEIMRWQFEVEEDAEESSAGRIVWTVDYEKNGLSRNSYFPPQDSRISAKISVLGDHPESIVTVFKVGISSKISVLSDHPKSIVTVFKVGFTMSFTQSILKVFTVAQAELAPMCNSLACM
jgi:hypothetical protein